MVRPPAEPDWTLDPYGELRAELSIARLDHLDARVPQSPTLTLGLSRALLGIDGTLADRLSVRVALWAGLDPVVAADGTGPTPSLVLHEAWARVEFGQFGSLVAGHQAMPFALGLEYGAADGFYFPGAVAFLDLSTRTGVVPMLQNALAYQLDLPAQVELDVALGQPVEGSPEFEPWIADVAGRVRFHPDDLPVAAGVSGLLKSRPDGHSNGAWHAYAGAFLEPASLRVLGELLGTAGDGHDALGFGLDVAATADLGLGPAQGVTGLFRLERWDPSRAAILDQTWSAALGATLDLDTGASDRPASIGLLYELAVPMDAALAIEHDVTVQVRAAF